MMDRALRLLTIAFALFAMVATPRSATSADLVKIGIVKSLTVSALFLAQEKAYFAAEGVQAEFVYFDASQPIALAATSGAIDFGVTGFTAGFYSLAEQGALKIIAGYVREAPGFHGLAYIASNQAYATGVKSLKDLADHSVAVTQIGSPPHYALGLVIDKYGLDAKTIRVLPLQTIANTSSAVSGGQADFGITTALVALPLVQRGEARLLGWVGDETPWELGSAFTSTKTIKDRPETVERFLRAYRRGALTYHDAFIGADDKPSRNASAPEILAILAKYTGLETDAIERGLPFIDRDARLDVKDVQRQIAWYESKGMLKEAISNEGIFDQRVIPLR